MSESRHVLLAGCGAVGSRLAAALEPTTVLLCADREAVAIENVGVAAFEAADVGARKAAVVAARHRARGGVAYVLDGDLRYTLRVGLARRLDAAILCLDNATALRDAAEVLWATGRADLPIIALTCGSAGRAWQARVFTSAGPCIVCLFGEAERRADQLGLGRSCADTSAPRAAATAAEAAARGGATILGDWLAGNRALANRRLQCDDGPVCRQMSLPPAPSPRCPVAHGGPPASERHAALGGGVAAVTVGDLVARASAVAGDRAELVLGRRALPLGGLWCPQCGRTAGARPLLVPAAINAASPCGCGASLEPLGTRSVVGLDELAAAGLESTSLAAWGAGHGDELVVLGTRASVRLDCDFGWSDLHEP